MTNAGSIKAQPTFRADAGSNTRSDNYTGAPGLAVFGRLVKLLLHCPSQQKGSCRDNIVRFILIAQDPDKYIDELLRLCTDDANPDRLGIAIDVLSQTGDVICDYAWSYFCRDVKAWQQWTERAYEPNDDYWYILLRSVARSQTDANRRLKSIRSCAGASSRGMREAVVEALGDLGTDAAHELLKSIAAHDEDPFVRSLARERLDDLEV